MRCIKVRITALLAFVAVFFLPLDLAHGAAPGAIDKVQVTGVENFSRLSGSSGFGGPVAGFAGATKPSAMAALKNAGFASVINLRLSDEEDVELVASRAAAETLGLRYIHLPLDSAKADPGVVEKTLAALGNPTNQPVYVHCGSATRAAAIWMIGRVLRDGWEIDAASAEARQIALKPEQAIAIATTYLERHTR